MNIGILTSSRADFGIYTPLLTALKDEPDISVVLIAFGTHTSPFHGMTITECVDSGFRVEALSTLMASDNPNGVSTSYGITVLKFADYWSSHSYDVVLCLGDRYEMCAAVQAGIPYGVKFAHLHGGEITLGAIDNIYRHQITLASTIHFVAHEQAMDVVKRLCASDGNIHVVGSLSLDGIEDFVFLPEGDFRRQYGLLDGDEFVLCTFHPETVDYTNNGLYAEIAAEAIYRLSKKVKVLVSLPNADTDGSVYRKALHAVHEQRVGSIILVENFGKTNYFSAMKYASLVVGNSSSGILEAASFGAYVVNVGQRQAGRAKGLNVVDVEWDIERLESTIDEYRVLGKYTGENIYYRKNAARMILSHLKSQHTSIL